MEILSNFFLLKGELFLSQIRMMARGALLALIFLMLPLSMLSNFTHADPLWLYTYCNPNTTDYAINSTFGNNLKALLEALPSYTSSSSGFNNTSVGESPDKAYGQALCRGDVNSSLCQNCVENASQEIRKECLSKDAIIWYQYCQIHYSFQNFFSTSVYTGKYPNWDSQEKNVSDPAHFYQFVVYLITELSSEAAKNSSRLMFATGELRYSRSDTIYGLVQCTRDISAGDCSSCLNNALEELNACCYGKQGGIMLSRNCDLGYELYSFYNATSNLLTYPSSQGNSWKPWMFAPLAVVVVLLIAAPFVVRIRRRRGIVKDKEKSQHALLQELATSRGVTMTEEGNLVSTEEMPLMDLIAIRAATDNFSDANKLGKGGFGTVYKGTLPDGKEIAIKRLSRRSWQGINQFRNEVMLIAKLQHRNLVRLLGCSTEGDEKLLIYEFMPNKSLDTFIFDSKKRAELDWNACHNIIVGIARGLLYLHEESRLKIIHRDLKPNNVLLDDEMVAKISDFGMARMFGENQNIANTKRVVGTFGYMSPEYAMEGLFSVKSDVFSYGVIVLEIISGRKNSGFYLTGHAQTLLAYAWRLWNEGKELQLIEPTLLQTGKVEEIVRCIHIGLLCVQEDADDRPPMSHVVALLGSEPITLPQPKEPAFAVGRVVPFYESPSTDPSLMPSPSTGPSAMRSPSTDPCANCVTVSDINPR